MLDPHTILTDVRSVFHEGRNITPKFSYMNICKNYKCYILIELVFLKVLILIRKGYQKGILFSTIIVFYMKGWNLKKKSAMKAMMY